MDGSQGGTFKKLIAFVARIPVGPFSVNSLDPISFFLYHPFDNLGLIQGISQSS